MLGRPCVILPSLKQSRTIMWTVYWYCCSMVPIQTDVVDKDGAHALFIAIGHNFPQVVCLLLKYNTTVNCRLFRPYDRLATFYYEDGTSPWDLDHINRKMDMFSQVQSGYVTPCCIITHHCWHHSLLPVCHSMVFKSCWTILPSDTIWQHRRLMLSWWAGWANAVIHLRVSSYCQHWLSVPVFHLKTLLKSTICHCCTVFSILWHSPVLISG